MLVGPDICVGGRHYNNENIVLGKSMNIRNFHNDVNYVSFQIILFIYFNYLQFYFQKSINISPALLQDPPAENQDQEKRGKY